MIVAPKGVYDNWVKQEIPNHLPDEFERLWSVGNRPSPKFPRRYEKLCLRFGRYLFINVEAFSTLHGKKAAYFSKQNPDNIMVIDESTTVKNRKLCVLRT